MAAKQRRNLAVRVTSRETAWGYLYLIASLFLLPALLQWCNALLPTPLSKVWFNFIYFVINFCFVFLIFINFYRRSLAYIGQNIPDFLLATVIGFCLYMAANWVLSAIIYHALPDYSNLNDHSVAQMAQDNFWVSALGAVLLVPLAEESLHRGLIFGSLYPKNHALAYAVSTIIFSVVHIAGYIGVYDPIALAIAFVQYLPAGLVLAWAYRKSGSIFAPILIHTAINAVGMFSLR